MSYVPLPAPKDIISCLRFSPKDDVLLAGSHDRSVFLYNCQNPKLVAEFTSPSPVLSIAYSGHSTYAGLSDGSIRQVDYENMKFSSGFVNSTDHHISHGISELRAVSESLVVGTSFDGNIYYFDPRMNQLVHKRKTGAKVFAMDATSNYITVGMSERKVEIYDLRNRESPWQTRASGLKYQITALRSFGEGYALSSIDGRVSIEYYDLSPQSQALKFAFKCHRHSDKAANVDTVYPVTELRFHHTYNTLFTAGGDGHVCVWDWQRRKRMKQFAPVAEPKAISHMDMNHDGTILAVGASDDRYTRKEDFDAPFEPVASKIHLKVLTAVECQPKRERQ